MREIASGGLRPEEHPSHRVEVGVRALLGIAAVLLERGVSRSNHRGERSGRARKRLARRAEIDQHRVAGLADEDVVGLDVAVQEAGRVDFLDAVEEWGHDAEDLRFLGLRMGVEPRLERLAALVVHHHVAGLVCLEVAHDAHDVGMAEAGEGARFLEEAVEPGLVVVGAAGARERDVPGADARDHAAGEELLDGDVLLEQRVAREIGDAEPAHAEDGVEAVLHQHRADGERVRIILRRRRRHLLNLQSPAGSVGL